MSMRLVHPRSGGRRQPRPAGRPQHHVVDRLPALGDDLAGLDQIMERHFGYLSEEERRPIVRNNAMRFTA